jgi:cell division protein FtsZ
MTTIRRYAADEAHVIFGTAYDESLGDALRVTVIATGLASAKRVMAPMQMVQPVQRTGTDNIPVLTQPLHAGQSPVGHASVSGHGVASGAAQDYNLPSVWRNPKAHAAARVEALANNGMDEIEIPAFLRKQAD